MRIGVLSVVFAAHWIAFGTLPFKLPQDEIGLASRRMAATSVSVRIGPTPALVSAPARIRPLINKVPAQANQPDIAPPESSVPQPTEADRDGLYGVSGMLDDDAPIVLITPPTIHLQYDSRGEINGRAYAAHGELRWQHDGVNYEASMDIGDLAVGSRLQTSTGQLTERGLEPLRFEDKTRSNIATQFDHVSGKVRFTPPVADDELTLGAQDELSVFIQLATLFAGNVDRLPPGSVLAFQTFGALASERWTFTVVGPELVMLPTGPVNAIHVTRDTGAEQFATLDLWLAPETSYLPLRIRLSDSIGSFVEQEWRASERP